MTARVTLRQCDAYAWLKRQPSDSVDHIITDPPYSDRVQSRIRSVYNQGGQAMREHGRTYHVAPEFDSMANYAWVQQCLRVARRWVLCFTDLESLSKYQGAAQGVHPKAYIRSGIVKKRQAAPQITGDRPGQRCEGIAIMHRPGRKRWNNGGKHAFWEMGRPPRADKWHPTQKSVALMCELIEAFSDPGETILDPFCGSGATVIAAHQLGRHVIGLDSGVRHADKRDCPRRSAAVGLPWVHITANRVWGVSL